MPDSAPIPATPVAATPVKPETAPAAPAGLPPPAEPAVAVSPASVAPAKAPEAPIAVEPPAAVPDLTLLGKEAKPPVEPKTTEATPKEPAAIETAPPEPAIAYEPFRLPDNFQRDEKAMGEFTDLLRGEKASQDLGQKLVDLYTREASKLYEQQRTMFADTINGWKEDVLADPELGGSRTQTVLASCGAVLEQFGTPELRQMFNLTGTGNHPEMVRFLNKIGKFLGEGKPIRADKPVPEVKPSRAARRYASSQG